MIASGEFLFDACTDGQYAMRRIKMLKETPQPPSGHLLPSGEKGKAPAGLRKRLDMSEQMGFEL